jgi:uncharacterized protein involved in type VI secretion and phage assembly
MMVAKPMVAIKRPPIIPSSKRVSRKRTQLLMADTKQKRARCSAKPMARPKTQNNAKRDKFVFSQRNIARALTRAAIAAHSFHFQQPQLSLLNKEQMRRYYSVSAP